MSRDVAATRFVIATQNHDASPAASKSREQQPRAGALARIFYGSECRRQRQRRAANGAAARPHFQVQERRPVLEKTAVGGERDDRRGRDLAIARQSAAQDVAAERRPRRWLERRGRRADVPGVLRDPGVRGRGREVLCGRGAAPFQRRVPRLGVGGDDAHAGAAQRVRGCDNARVLVRREEIRVAARRTCGSATVDGSRCLRTSIVRSVAARPPIVVVRIAASTRSEKTASAKGANAVAGLTGSSASTAPPRSCAARTTRPYLGWSIKN